MACERATLHKCDGSGRSETAQDCSSEALCSEELGKCNACVPRSVSCAEDGAAVRTCSDDGQTQSSRACDESAPICLEGLCGECRLDGDPSKTGCARGNECARVGSKLACRPVNGVSSGLKVQFCHAGACKITLAPGFDLDLKADWTMCVGAPAPLGAPSVGVMLWPTALTDLAIPLADSGWFCKLAPKNGGSNGCVINSSQTARDLYIWGPIENTCTYAWGRTSTGIDATLGAGCGMCKLVAHADEDSAEYAFNMGTDRGCRCPKLQFAAIPAKRDP